MKIILSNLVKQYGATRALDGINLEVPGGMFGLLGPNGAGKTTLMRIISTLLAPTSGRIFLGEIDLLREPGLARQHLGYLPQDFGFYKGLNAFEMLDYIAAMKNIPRAERRGQIEEALAMVNLLDVARRRVGGYSGGMKQRLGIAQALLGHPSLIIVDEPTAGLDPEERIRFRNLLSRLAVSRTVLLSTHIVDDVEASCTGLAVLRRGRLRFTGTAEALTEEARGKVWQVEVTPSEWEVLAARYRVVASRTEGRLIQVRVLAEENPLGRGVPAEATLEDGYLAAMGDGPDEAGGPTSAPLGRGGERRG